MMRGQEETLELYEKFSEVVYRVCVLHLKNAQDAYDATQETFLRLMQDVTKFENDEHAKAWLIVTASNCSKNMLKCYWRKNIIGGDTILHTENQTKEEHFQKDEVSEAILNLPEKYKNIVYLHYYEGYTIEEIAKLFHKKSSTMRSRLYKARKLLKNYLEEEEKDENEYLPVH